MSLNDEYTGSGDNLIALTADIVAAYVAHNTMVAENVPAFVASVHEALLKAQSGAKEPVQEELKPAVPIKKSVTPDYIICLDDGLRFKSIKRHVKAKYGLSMDEYRKKWGLPSDYPAVAPNYAAQRSELAKSMGLGQRRKLGEAA